MALLAQYRTVPSIEAIIRKIEHRTDEPNWQNALANELFHFYFPPAAGWMVLPRRGRADRHAGVVLRVGRWDPNTTPGPTFDDRVVVIVRKSEGDGRPEMKKELKVLHDAGVIKNKVHWVALFFGRYVCFYSCEMKASGEVVGQALGPPMHPGRYVFDVQSDCLAVEEMMRYMAYR